MLFRSEYPMRVGPSHAEIKIVARLVELDHREEIMWRERSRVQWLSEGNKNTRFFHLHARQRKMNNKITSLRLPSGEVTEDHKVMTNANKMFYCD